MSVPPQPEAPCRCAIVWSDRVGLWHFQRSAECPVHTLRWARRFVVLASASVVGVLAVLVAVAVAVWR